MKKNVNKGKGNLLFLKTRSFLKKVKRRIDQYTLLHYGIILFAGQISFKKYRKLKADLKRIKNQASLSNIQFPVTKLYPCYRDEGMEAGSLTLEYFHQDLFIAQRIYTNNPIKHVDIGSSISGLVAHVASFRDIEVFDIRPLYDQFSRIYFKQADLMRENDDLVDYTDSISCLHALEHFGLGRYGDPVCFEGHILGFNNITKMLRCGGKFYFSVPLGTQRIEFHAHRIFSLKYLCEMIEPFYKIDSFSYVNDNGNFYKDVTISDDNLSDNCGCSMGLAIFELTKKEDV
jgi:hypothetical protein